MAEGKTYHNVLAHLTADLTTLTLIPSPPAGPAADNYHPAIRIHRIIYHPSTSTAETFVVNSGSVNIFTVPTWAFLVRDTGWLEEGILCPDETALICTPSAAGNAGDFYITYSIENNP
jgi:hypothetical protein